MWHITASVARIVLAVPEDWHAFRVSNPEE
jgi:hypothetical protein